MKNNSHIRILVLSAAVLLIFVFYSGDLIRLQLPGDGTDTETEKTDIVADYPTPVKSARGEILDSSGQPLVTNRQGTSVVIYSLLFPEDRKTQNAILISLIHVLESNGDEWNDDIPLQFDAAGNIQFENDRDEDIAFMRSDKLLTLNTYATAQNCLDTFVREYELQDFTPAEQRKLASVYYGMARTEFTVFNPYTFAEDISDASSAYLMEHNEYFTGVQTIVSAYREYAGDGTLAAHALGVVGVISAEEYQAEQEKTDEKLKDTTLTADEISAIKANAYGYNDDYGKFGLEAVMESYLKGTNGVLDFLVDSEGNITQDYSVLPQPGNTVVTTIIKGLQEVAEKSLKERIDAVTTEEVIASGLTPAGAVIVLDVHTGAVRAIASYPTFSLETYYDDYNTLLNDPGKPLWNRTTQSTYSPGSTMKCAVACAALEEGIIDEDDTFFCGGTYQYKDILFACAHQTVHGYVNVKTALEYSCNIFFYQVAEKLGIEKIQEYARKFGLGDITGIEINESDGILAGPEYRDSIGGTWQMGETLLAAIGQSDNSFSMIQLANYVATIANGGTRYKPYLVEKVLSPDYSETLLSHTPEIVAQTGISAETFEIVKEGMYLVANEGTCQQAFAGLTRNVAAKTGTAEKTRKVNDQYVEGTDGFLITFGPYEDPEIAIAVVVENAGSGAATAQVAADIYDYYFKNELDMDTVQTENALIY